MYRNHSALTRDASDPSFEISRCRVLNDVESLVDGIVTEPHISGIIVVKRPRALADLNCALLSCFDSMSSSAFRDSWREYSGIEVKALEISESNLSRSRSACDILVDNDFCSHSLSWVICTELLLEDIGI